MDSQPTLQTVPLECLIEIVSHLSLPECLELRTVCSQLKAAVDDHFRFVDTLQIVLSAPNSHVKGLELEAYFQKKNWFRHYEFGNVTFGLPVTPHRCLTMFEKKRILHKQARHFRRENFLILPNTSANIDGFIKFISKYLPKVNKLALIIDYDHKLVDEDMAIPQRIVSFYRERLKVLLLNKSTRSGWTSEMSFECFPDRYSFELSEQFYTSIESLEMLQELHFFDNKTVRTKLYKAHGPNDYVRPFIRNMLLKLKVFHMNSSFTISNLEPIVADTLEEMDYNWNWLHIVRHSENFRFPAIKEIHIGSIWMTSFPRDLFDDCFPNLRALHLDELFDVKDVIASLNNISQLERLHCHCIRSPETLKKQWRFAVHYLFKGIPVNRTIKHLVIENMPNDELQVERILNEVRLSLPYFAALETVTIREPFMKLTVDELMAQ